MNDCFTILFESCISLAVFNCMTCFVEIYKDIRNYQRFVENHENN